MIPAWANTSPKQTHPAKLQVLRAQVESGRLDVLADITKRADGDRVRVRFLAKGKRFSFTAPVNDGRVRFKRALPKSQQRVRTGIMEIVYEGGDRVHSTKVRLRAASGKALLKRDLLSLQDGVLAARGSLTNRAEGVVRLILSYERSDGSVGEWQGRAAIRDDGTWGLEERLPFDAQAGGYLSIQFTGYYPRHIRGEQIAKQVLAAPALASGFMLISAERLASLPTTGTAYDYMKARADAAMSDMNLSSTPDSTSPWLPNYNGSGTVTRPGVQTLAAALVYARTGDEHYRDFVIRANRFVIGTEDEASTDGTSAGSITLAMMRNISAYVLAADLVGMDPNLTGSRPGYTGTVWKTWLGELRTKMLTTSGNCPSMVRCNNERAHNWGAFASASRVSIDIYLNDQADLAVAVSRLKRWLGESSEGLQWKPSQDFDESYACIPLNSEWTAVNGSSCGLGKDGMLVEDISRSVGSFPTYDKTGIGYTTEGFQGQLLAAILLERQGYDVFNWGDQALRRVMDWLEREGKPFGNNYSVERHLSWIPHYFYQKSYSTSPSNMGRTLGFTDWLYGG
jgi:hypothetical protein